MQNDKIVVGLDIGTTKICAIVGRKNEFGKLEILGMGKAVSEGVSRGVVVNIDKTVLAIKKAIAEAEEDAGVGIGIVNVGIAGQHIKSSMHHGSIIRHSANEEITVADIERLTNDMYKIVTPPGSKILHVVPQDFTVDYEEDVKEPVGMLGSRLEADFHIITAQTNAIGNIKKCVERAGLDVAELILEPIASSMAVLDEEEKQAGVALVDIGGGTTDIAIVYEGIIRHTAVIPLGGNIITADIKEGLSVMAQQAEKLKVKFGKALPEMASINDIISIPGLRDRAPKEISLRNLANIIESRVKEILELVHNEIIMAGYAKKLAGGIVLTGGGSQLQHIKQLAEFMTGMDVRIGYPNEHLGRSKTEEVKSPMYATTVGLVLAGFGAFDERENRYNNQLESVQQQPTTRTQQPKESGSNFFSTLIAKAKDVLMDDYDGSKSNY
ncbi:MAG: cell division protein FtsA [Bacteroidota bacterium]|jgi:cell division protein FtsA